VTRELFYEKLKSDDSNRIFADDVECSLKQIEEMIGSYHGVLPMSMETSTMTTFLWTSAASQVYLILSLQHTIGGLWS
jgi:hypothetical protein